jgi:hypothetical protein
MLLRQYLLTAPLRAWPSLFGEFYAVTPFVRAGMTPFRQRGKENIDFKNNHFQMDGV